MPAVTKVCNNICSPYFREYKKLGGDGEERDAQMKKLCQTRADLTYSRFLECKDTCFSALKAEELLDKMLSDQPKENEPVVKVIRLLRDDETYGIYIYFS